MHIHTHFRHHYSFLTSYVISNKKRFPAKKKKKKGRLLASRLIQENIPVIATSSPSKRKKKKKEYKNTELTKLSFLYCVKGELISTKNLELPQLNDAL